MSTVATLERPAAHSFFAPLPMQAPDALLGLIRLFEADPHPHKIDLGVGMYRDATGATPVMRAVKQAEAQLLDAQASKSYLGPEGDIAFVDLLARIVFGDATAASNRLTGVQTPGGTGALRLGAELIAHARPDARAWIGDPTWPNHAPIFREAGLAVCTHRFFDRKRGAIDFAGMMADLAEMRAGDVLLLHGCCHNPTGAMLAPDQWAAITQACVARGIMPFVDLAYQGLGDGLETDGGPMRAMLEAVPDALVAYSCDKNFALYRERVGALWLQASSARAAESARGNMLALARGIWSMPPDHGAAIVRTILDSATLSADWSAELDTMRERLNDLRRTLAAAYPALAPIAGQRGMFALLDLSPQAVTALRERHGIYMAGNGRINIAGLRIDTIPTFAAALAPYLE